MEAAVVNLLSPGETAVVIGGGRFAERWRDLLTAFGARPEYIDVPWGRAVNPADVESTLERVRGSAAAPVVFMNQSETSTGVLHDVEGVARVVRERGGILVVDAVSSLAAHPLPMDAWGVDVVVSGSQKGLMLPPGLGLVSVGERAAPRVESAKLPRFYFDLRKARTSLAKGEAPFTPAITLVLALRTALDMIEAEGLPAIYARHERIAAATRAAVTGMGLRLYAQRPSNVVTSIELPEGEAGAALPRRLREQFGFRVAGGQGALKGKIMRIGHLGYYDAPDVIGLVSALERVLVESGFPVRPGDGVAAAQRELAS
jgi:aspartate aminotransferase-like enzyme